MSDPSGFNELIGLTVEHADGQGGRATLVVEERHLQPHGIVHGGVYGAIAEAVASVGTHAGTGGEKLVVGLSNLTSFLRPVLGGDTISAVGTPRHRGRTTWVWEVDLINGEGKLCATTRVTIAVRDQPL